MFKIQNLLSSRISRDFIHFIFQKMSRISFLQIRHSTNHASKRIEWHLIELKRENFNKLVKKFYFEGKWWKNCLSSVKKAIWLRDFGSMSNSKRGMTGWWGKKRREKHLKRSLRVIMCLKVHKRVHNIQQQCLWNGALNLIFDLDTFFCVDKETH